MSKTGFASALVVLFVGSFALFNTYIKYELNGSKVERYKYLSEYRTRQINEKIAESYAGIAELKQAQHEFDNYHFPSSDLGNLNRKNGATSGNQSSIESAVLLNPFNEAKLAESVDITEEEIRLNPLSVMEPLALNRFNLESDNQNDELTFVPENNNALKSKNYYVGVGFQPSIGLANYRNAEQIENVLSAGFEVPVSSDVLSESHAIVWGLGANVYGGLMLNKHLSVEGGISYAEFSGSSNYRYEHTYQKEIQRLEWIVSGEDDVQALVTSDFVETSVIDSVNTQFSRAIVSVPLHLNYSVDYGRFSPFVSVGTSMNFTLNGQQNTQSSFLASTNESVESKGLSQINLSVGAGVDVELTSNLSARIKPNYEFGVWNNNPTHFSGNLNNLNLQTGLLYKF